ncbi:MAG: fructose-6-phosphate aldolase [Lachnospiraceae bacterium]
MKYLLDTANIKDIQTYCEYFPIAGVTSNPSIVKKENRTDFFEHMGEIRKIIGGDKDLHIQVTAAETDGMLRDADTILNKIDTDVLIKVPVTMDGIRAIRLLAGQGIRVTGTAVYSKAQGFLALEAGAACIAPYFNRMENLGLDPDDIIASIAQMIEQYHYPTEILAASFKNAGQVDRAFLAGAQSATADPAILVSALKQAHIIDAVAAFDQDWKSLFGNRTIAEM